MDPERSACLKCFVVKAGFGHLLRSSDAERAVRCVQRERLCLRPPDGSQEDDRARQKDRFAHWGLNRRKQ